MRPYRNIRIEQFPDLADIKLFGMKSSAGRFPGANGEDIRAVQQPRKKKAERRRLKRVDRARLNKDIRNGYFG